MRMPVDGEALRQVMRRWPTGITVLTTATAHGPHGITVNSFTSLSLDPPLCLVCIDKRAKAHEEIPVAGGFVVNILAEDQADLSARFAGRRPDLVDLFSGLECLTAPSGHPVFSGALGFLDCSLHTTLPGGDHTIFVGRVEHAAALSEAAPLLFFGGQYRTLAQA